MQSSVSLQLSEVILRVADSGDYSTLRGAKERLLHGLGVALGSAGLPASEVAWRTMRDQAGACRVIGRTTTLTPGAAAFVNAVAAHNSLQEDCGPGGLAEGSHPGTYVLPAGLAAAEQCGASGRDFLRGIIAGYEAVSRIGMAAPDSIVGRGFRPVPVMAPFGAAAAAAVVRGADAGQLAAALSIAANLSSGFGQGILEGTMEPYLHAGFGTRNGMLAADLAVAGAVAARGALDGRYGFFAVYGGAEPDLDALLGDRARAGVNRVGSKRFAACLQNQQTMELALDVIAPRLSMEDALSVTLLRPAKGANGTHSPGVDQLPPYGTMLQAQMAARFTAAAALLGRPVEEVGYFAAAMNDAEAMALAARIELRESPDESVSLELRLHEGPVRVFRSSSAAGLFPAPDVLLARFRKRAEAAIGDRAPLAVALIERMEAIDNVRELTALLAPAERRLAPGDDGIADAGQRPDAA
jgi:2-methylcitrate dehydratase PrpD